MRVVIADSNLLPHRTLLEEALPAGTATSWHDTWNEAALVDDLRDADVYVGPRFTARMGSAAEKLRLVHVAGAGYDGIDADALPAACVCANTFHHENSIAEHIAAVLVALRRNLLGQDAALRTGAWASSVYSPAIPQPETLRESVVAFLGFGHIGQASWSLLRAFGAEGIAVTRSGAVDAAAHDLRWAGTTAQLGAALTEADVLVVSIPLGDETRSVIGAVELDELGPAGLLVNVARGPVVDEAALYEALRDRRIAGAAIDVWYRYPGGDGKAEPANLPFGRLDNVIMTPHSSGVTAETFRGRVRDIAANITSLSRNEPLKNVVIPS
ncbi:2-hydroxyacid dehydrogenase [Sinomonas sp. ASV322]|uniref:2-hydroxyacid dehydrogenase n=1 Tax=Sinomonas sp. ASV322 TaxID=3041920 RepID=UPI0027DE750B|nr:2-hydroxyacid dehydrogenase [Sinomonas sp. ASV322]MDQ4502535.1 2-hydroxyacid dehydrogenase [Sinomonas sp. ASV322]